jgi:hypothetical protein
MLRAHSGQIRRKLRLAPVNPPPCAQRRRVVGPDCQLPVLERLAGDALAAPLRERDLVEQPIGQAWSATYFAPSVNSTSRTIPCKQEDHLTHGTDVIMHEMRQKKRQAVPNTRPLRILGRAVLLSVPGRTDRRSTGRHHGIFNGECHNRQKDDAYHAARIDRDQGDGGQKYSELEHAVSLPGKLLFCIFFEQRIRLGLLV